MFKRHAPILSSPPVSCHGKENRHHFAAVHDCHATLAFQITQINVAAASQRSLCYDSLSVPVKRMKSQSRKFKKLPAIRYWLIRKNSSELGHAWLSDK